MTARSTPSIRGLLKGLLGVVVVLAALLSVVTILQVRTATARSQAERQRVTSFRLSDGMRQSSNDLTRMVRLYVTTGEARYRRYYDQILDIRSGQAPRPLDYDSSYWDRVLADGESKERRGPPAALTELMRRAHFSPDEFSALAASLEASNHLAQLELEMMNKVAPRIAAGADRREYLREVAPAYERLVDDEYHAQKRKIMAAIDRFTALVDQRTARRAEELQGRTNQLLAAQTAILVLLAAVLAAGLLVSARAIVRPLSRLADVTRRITHGDWSHRAEPHGVAELTQLAGDFNEMADAVQNDLAGRRRAEREAREAEREAREAENRLQTIADRVPGAVFQFHVGRDGGFSVRFASRNGSIHRTERNHNIDFPGMARAVLPEDRGQWLDTMLDAARSGQAWAHEYRILTDDGEIAWMQGQALTVRGEDGSAELYGYVADVTERKALEADLRRAREDAEAADRAKSAFLAMMSHELRTPLVAVTGTLEILALDALDERQRELVDVAMGSSRALLAVIGDVLDFSKLEAGFLDLSPAPVAVGPLVQDVAGQHRHGARLRGLDLTTETDPALAAAHVVDEGRLRQVLGNLLSNAVKFTREGGVTVSVRALDDGAAGEQRLALDVTDTGIGISAQDQRRLFVPFTQASTDNARSSEGTGLGLAICRQLVEAMGGVVTLRSAPGAGTTVTIELTLPVAERADAGDGLAGLPSQAARRGPHRRALPSHAAAEAEGSLVLLVEDHPVNRRVLAAQLEAIGFRVDAAADAGEALTRFADTTYGLVFTDIQLPHVDGYELARRLRDAERAGERDRTPLLALTASALKGELDRCRAVGMDDVVTKPTTLAILSATLRRYLPHIDWPEPDAASAPALPAPAIDGSALDELVAGDAELGAQILASYAASIQAEVKLLADALDDGDHDTLRRCAHQVASASRAVGAVAAADAAQRLEQGAGTGAPHAALAADLHALRDALVAVVPVSG